MPFWRTSPGPDSQPQEGAFCFLKKIGEKPHH